MTQWKYEAATKTIRSVPSNHWIATMDSWDGAVDNEANAILIAAAPTMASRIQGALDSLSQNKVFPADIENAKRLLIDALTTAGITNTGLDRFDIKETGTI